MIKSEQINELAAALSKAQGEMPEAELDGENSFFKDAQGRPSKYPTLSSYLRAAKPILAKHGLSVTQLLSTSQNGKYVMLTMLLHSSGQTIGSELELLIDKSNMQSLGSAISYARRYGFAAITGMGQEDDDANQAVQKSAPGPKVSVGAAVKNFAQPSRGQNPGVAGKTGGVPKNEPPPPPPMPWPGEADLR
jgi:hypothetical protein